jgi:hypothetical protein
MRITCLTILLALCMAFTPAAADLVCGQEQKPLSQAGPGLGILEAVRTTLELHPLLLFQQKQIDISRALKQQRSADFDPLLQWSATQKRTNNPLTASESLALQQSGLVTNNQATNLTTMSGSIQRLLRSGVVIGPRIEMNRTTDNLQSAEGASRARLSFEVNVPLRRGKGREVVTCTLHASLVCCAAPSALNYDAHPYPGLTAGAPQ